MSSHIPQKSISGETLPLFALGQSIGGQSAGRQLGIRRTQLARELASADRHMHVAWQLSKALKAVKTGRKSAQEAGLGAAKLNARQRHQVGNAICEHLLASLRQQVVSEAGGKTNYKKQASTH